MGLVALCGVLAAVIAVRPAPAYKLDGFAWASHSGTAKIKYFNKIDSREAAIRSGVKAWNSSGLGIHFQAVAKASRASVVLTPDPDVACGVGFAEVTTRPSGGRVEAIKAKVTLGTSKAEPLLDSPAECRFIDTLTTAHELGHALGLRHDDSRCALMNSSVATYPSRAPGGPVGAAPKRCKPPGEFLWYCGVLSEDDLKGAGELYRGPGRPKKPAFCPLPGG